MAGPGPGEPGACCRGNLTAASWAWPGFGESGPVGQGLAATCRGGSFLGALLGAVRSRVQGHAVIVCELPDAVWAEGGSERAVLKQQPLTEALPWAHGSSWGSGPRVRAQALSSVPDPSCSLCPCLVKMRALWEHPCSRFIRGSWGRA